MTIELLDLKPHNAACQADVEAALLRVARSGRYILGREVEGFEREWAAYCGVPHCIGTGNALEALQMILAAHDIGPGDEVIVPANTYIATWLSVTHCGATPVPVDADAESFNIDPTLIEAAITRRTKAIIAVHLYGRAAEMDQIAAIAADYGLYVFEDAAQAHGARLKGRRAGALSHAAAFSFYPSKNLGALGDAGAVTTGNYAIAERIRRMRNYGGVGRLDHTFKGINSRLDEMQAAVLRAKLPYLNEENFARRMRADAYLEQLADTWLKLPQRQPGGCWHQFVVRAQDRAYLQASLQAMGVDTHVHYPVPPYLEGAYAEMNIRRGRFPVAERLANEVFSLPIGYPFDQAAVIAALHQVCAVPVPQAAHA